MNKLVAFGCSYTYGHGLVDCLDPPYNPGPNPSKFAWPTLVAEKRGQECVNKSRPGASNYEILDTILHYPFTENDTVVVMWTFFSRDMLIDDSGKSVYVYAGNGDTISDKWLDLHTNADLATKSWVYMHHAHQHLKTKNVKFHFLSTDLKYNLFLKYRPLYTRELQFFETDLDKLNGMFNFPRALDGTHPGPECHKTAAELIYMEMLKAEAPKA